MSAHNLSHAEGVCGRFELAQNPVSRDHTPGRPLRRDLLLLNLLDGRQSHRGQLAGIAAGAETFIWLESLIVPIKDEI